MTQEANTALIASQKARKWDHVLRTIASIPPRAPSTVHVNNRSADNQATVYWAPNPRILALASSDKHKKLLHDNLYGQDEADQDHIDLLRATLLHAPTTDVDGNVPEKRPREDMENGPRVETSESLHSLLLRIQGLKEQRAWNEVIITANILASSTSDNLVSLGAQQILAEAYLYTGDLSNAKNLASEIYTKRKTTSGSDRKDIQYLLSLLANVYDLGDESQQGDIYRGLLDPDTTLPLFRNAGHSWLAIYNANLSVDGLRVTLPAHSSLSELAFKAISFKDVHILECLLEQGVHVDSKCRRGTTLLIEAILYDFREGVDLLFKEGADVNYPGMDYYTPLMASIVTRNATLFQLLMSKGAKVNARTQDGRYEALHYAAAAKCIDISHALLKANAKVSHSMTSTITPLHFAAMSNCLDIIDMLVKRNAPIDAFDSAYFQTPLHYAAIGESVAAAEKLITLGAAVSKRDRDAKTPLDIATAGGDLEMVDMLVEHGAVSGEEAYTKRLGRKLHKIG